MNTSNAPVVFAGSIPQVYERYMVPMLFEPYAADIAARVVQCAPRRVLEVAAGTGVVTRRLAATLPAEATLVATDLNQPMLDVAAAHGVARPVAWRQADAAQLPYGDASVDVVVCQFGAMFFPDKPAAYAEARRVLRPGGRLIFNVWDRIELSEFADVVMQALARLFPADPPSFMARIPHGYHDPQAIVRDLAAGGWTAPPEITMLPARSRAESPRAVALALCQGTPMRIDLESRGTDALAAATDAAAAAIAQRFGNGAVEGPMQALVISVGK